MYLEVCHAGYILIKLKINNGSESKAVPMTVTYSKQLATMACYLSLNETLCSSKKWNLSQVLLKTIMSN